jgi:hypothetical protein
MYFHTDLRRPFCMDLYLCKGPLSCWNRKGPSPNCCAHSLSRMSLYVVAVRFRSLELRGLARTMKNSPRPLFLLQQTFSWHFALGQVAFFWHPPNPDSSIGLPDGEAWFITSVSAFPLLQSFIPLQATLGIAHGDLRLVCGYSATETNFMRFPTNSSCADFASRGSLELSSEDRRFLRTTRFSIRRSRSVSLCGLPLCGWAVDAPSCFHFAITALTVDQGSCNRAEIWWTELLERWHPMTLPHW